MIASCEPAFQVPDVFPIAKLGDISLLVLQFILTSARTAFLCIADSPTLKACVNSAVFLWR